MNTTPLQANLHPASQKRRRICFMLSPDLPAYLALIQRISRFHAWWSTALKMALDTPCRKWFAHPARDILRLRRSSSRSWWRVDLYVFSGTLSLMDWMAFLDGLV